MHNTYKAKGFEILSINVDDDLNAAKTYVKQQKPGFQVFEAKQVKELYGVRGIPITFFIDRQGNIRKTETGFNPKDGPREFSILIEELLKAK